MHARRFGSSDIIKKGTTVALVCLYRQRTQELATLDVRFTTKRPSAGTLERGSGLFAPRAGDDTSIGSTENLLITRQSKQCFTLQI